MSEQRTFAVYLPEGDSWPILVEPHETVEHRNDETDILDMVRKRIEERGLKPIDIRKAGVTKWNAEKHWRLRHGGYGYSMKAAYQLAVAVGL